MPARIGFSTSSSPVSWAIRRLTDSDVSHCFVTLDMIGVQCVLEAHDTGFRAIPLNHFYETNTVVDILDPEVPLEPVLPDALEWLGRPYDFVGLVGFLWVLLGRRLGRTWTNPFRSMGRQFCSEAVVRLLQMAKHPGASLLDPESTSPADLLLFLRRTSADEI